MTDHKQEDIDKFMDIKREVSIQRGISIAHIEGRSHKAAITEARHECMHRGLTETHLSSREIGQMLGGRVHSTVLFGAAVHAMRNGLEPATKTSIEKTYRYPPKPRRKPEIKDSGRARSRRAGAANVYELRGFQEKRTLADRINKRVRERVEIMKRADERPDVIAQRLRAEMDICLSPDAIAEM